MSNVDQSLDFSLDRIELPSRITMNGVSVDTVLREITGADKDKWLNAQITRMKYAKGQPSGMTSIEGVTARLIQLGYFRKVPRPEGSGYTLDEFSIQEIQGWPNRVQKGIADKLREISGLEDEDEEKTAKREDEAKNE